MADEPTVAEEPTVFVVDDDPDLRRSLGELLGSAALPCETFATRKDFLRGHDATRAGCLVLDIKLGGDDGLDVQDELRRRRIGLPVVVLTGHGDVAHCRRAFKAGAVDFLEKPVAPERLLESVRKALALDRESRTRNARRRKTDEHLARLTPREREVLDYLLAAKTSKEIGTQLGISDRTVEKHRREILRKLEVDSTPGIFRVVLDARDDPLPR